MEGIPHNAVIEKSFFADVLVAVAGEFGADGRLGRMGWPKIDGVGESGAWIFNLIREVNFLSHEVFRMQYKTLGNTGLLVSQICLGAMTFGIVKEGLWEKVAGLNQAEVDGLIKASVAAGVNFIDTADVYTNGQSETMVGQSLKNLGIARTDVVVATKVFGRTGKGWNDVGASRGHIMDGVDASLKRLQTDYIDLYQIHGTDSVTPIEETIRALDTLVQQGKVRYVGLSNWHAWRIMKALGISEMKNLVKFDTLQAYYSIAGRDLEREIVPLLEDQKMGLLVWSPLAGGLLSGKFSRDNQKPEDSRRSNFDFPLVDKERTWNVLDVMTPIAKAHGVSVATVALGYVLAKPFVTSVIIGAKRLDQLKENLAAAELVLSAEEMKRLDEVSALPVEYPGWMVPFQNVNRLADVPRF
jgi:aryl-alcohol dehydrogenase-like predicted oxidoreductase